MNAKGYILMCMTLGFVVVQLDLTVVNVATQTIGATGIWLSIRYAKETPANPERNAAVSGQVTAIVALLPSSAF